MEYYCGTTWESGGLCGDIQCQGWKSKEQRWSNPKLTHMLPTSQIFLGLKWKLEQSRIVTWHLRVWPARFNSSQFWGSRESRMIHSVIDKSASSSYYLRWAGCSQPRRTDAAIAFSLVPHRKQPLWRWPTTAPHFRPLSLACGHRLPWD